MGRYASQGTLVPSLMSELLVAQITRDDAAATTVDEDVLDTIIEDVESEVDTYVGVRYALPLASVPVLITRLASRLTRYRLYTSRPGTVEEWIEKDYARDIKTLEEIRDGRRELGLTAAGEAAGAEPNAGRAVRASSLPPVFGRSNMGDF